MITLSSSSPPPVTKSCIAVCYAIIPRNGKPFTSEPAGLSWSESPFVQTLLVFPLCSQCTSQKSTSKPSSFSWTKQDLMLFLPHIPTQTCNSWHELNVWSVIPIGALALHLSPASQGPVMFQGRALPWLQMQVGFSFCSSWVSLVALLAFSLC